MTGSQILAAFESIGARVRLTPAGVVDVQSPDVPELERLVAEVKANRSEVVEELKRHAAPAHPCIDCGREADERTLFCPTCWDRRREQGRLLAFGRRACGTCPEGDARRVAAPPAFVSPEAASSDVPAPGGAA